MIKIDNVLFKYKNSDSYVLDNISFTVNDGEVIAIVGENGSGKSTIGKIICGIIKVKQGKVLIDDLDITDKKNNKYIQEKIGIVFQNPENQIIFNSIYDELVFSLKGLEQDVIESRIDKALEEVNMTNYKNCDLYTLSLGQKQRIMIAEILAKKPKYVVLDEPTTMIDSQGKEAIYKIIANLKKEGYTIICITNLADEILLADRTLILDNGRIVNEIKKEELINNINVLKQHGIRIPTLLEIITLLDEYGIKLDIKDFSVIELAEKLRGKLKNEECN